MKRKLICAILGVTLFSSLCLGGCALGKSADQPASSSDSPDATLTSETEVEVTEPTPELTSEQNSEPTPESDPAEETACLESNWTTIIDTEYTHKSNMEGFFNENYGITVGYGGEIHYTNDGGQTWPQGTNSSACRFCIDIIDENLTWSGGNGAHVRVTKDGGKSWEAVTDANLGSIHSNIDFIDNTTGWISTFTKCAVTEDGGTTWTELTLPEDVKSIAAICLRTPDDGYLLSHNGLFFTTSDGGATWSKQDLKIEDYKVINSKSKPGLFKNNSAVADISFTDKDNGIIIFTGIVPGEGYKVWAITTFDGGTTWEAEQITTAEGFKPTKVFLSGDGRYLTLCSVDKRIIVMKRMEE